MPTEDTPPQPQDESDLEGKTYVTIILLSTKQVLKNECSMIPVGNEENDTCSVCGGDY